MADKKKNDLRWAASRRKLDGKSAGRQEVTGSDVMFKGEAEYDADMGKVTPTVTESEMAVNE